MCSDDIVPVPAHMHAASNVMNLFITISGEEPVTSNSVFVTNADYLAIYCADIESKKQVRFELPISFVFQKN